MNSSRLPARVAWLTVALAAWVAVPVRAGDDADDALAALNDVFRAAYGRARAAVTARRGPVILVRHDRLTLLRGDGREEESGVVIPPQYHRLKAVAHVPLAVFVLLAPGPDGDLGDDRLDELRALRDKVAAARRALGRCGFTPEQLDRQQGLIDRSLAFLDAALERKSFRREDLDALARASGPPVLANAAEAAALQIEGYHAQVTAWRRTLTPEQWRALRVVVVGRQLPRKGNVAVRYFAKLLGEPGEGPRLVYAEELSGDQAALTLLATHELDRAIGRAFFGDPARMERDLLGDGAADYLKGRDLDLP